MALSPVNESAVAYSTTGSSKASTALPASPVAGNLLVAVCTIGTTTAGTGSMSGGTGTWTIPVDPDSPAITADQTGNASKVVVFTKTVQAGDPTTYTYNAPAGGHGGIKVYQFPAGTIVRNVVRAGGGSGESAAMGSFTAPDADSYSLSALFVNGTSKSLSASFSLDSEQLRSAWADRSHGAVLLAPVWTWVTLNTYGAVLVTFGKPAAVGTAPTNVTVTTTGVVSFNPATPPSGQTVVGYTATAVPLDVETGGTSTFPVTFPITLA